jgi:signal transduction histidine kinase/CheY-like chemotaxis protein
MSSVLLVIAFGAFYLPASIIALTLVCYVIVEVWGVLSVKWIRYRMSWPAYGSLLASACIGAAVFLRIPYEMWQLDGFTPKLFTFCTLTTSLIHCATVRTYHLPLAVVTGLPVVVTIYLTFIDALLAQGSMMDTFIGLAVITLMITYITMMMFAGGKFRRSLIEALETADSANAAKGRFLAAMSHEIRTPLNGILGIADLLMERAQKDDEREKIEILLHSANSLKTIVDDVLDHAKVEAGKLELKPAAADLHEVARSVVGLFKQNAKQRDLWLRLHIDSGTPKQIVFDPLRVRQILSNLVSNAIKFTEKGGVDIFVSADEVADGSVRVSMRVADTGVGIPASMQHRLFDSFAQFDEERERAASGTGLGLAISHGLAQLMDGQIEVSSEPGRGSEFRLVFTGRTVVQEAAALRDHQLRHPTDIAIGSGRILLVDDNASNRFVVRGFLKKSNIVVVEAEDGLEAVEKAQAERFDLILLDMHMPRMNGRQAFKHIRARGACKTTPVVVLTADSAPEDRDIYLGAGMDGYLAKPITKAQLMAEVSRFMPAPALLHTAAE